MAKKEAKTDLWVHSLLTEAGINLEPQGSSVHEINNALKTASKSGSGNVGFPEFVGVVKDFILVIENKADLVKHIKLNDKVISQDVKDIKDYAVNGALFYAKHLANHTSYRKIIAFGISGDAKKHKISPIYVDETPYYRELPEVESFISFTEKNIQEYYIRTVLKEKTNSDKELSEILRDAAQLHEDLRNFGSLKDIDKPLIVSGILLALREAEHKNFSIDDLIGDTVKTDGHKIFDAVKNNLQRANVAPEVKLDKILGQFSIIKDTTVLNEKNDTLGKTPLKHFTEFLNKKIYHSIKYTNSSEDYLGRFYGEFMSYSGGDGQTLGIVLTPKHITDLFCDLVDIKPSDVVLDPCAGTAGFLIAAMHHMLAQADSETVRKNIRQKQLHGFELQPYMFTVATTNMILRGDGKSNLINNDFLKEDSSRLQLHQPTIGMMNPPYSQGSKKCPSLYEIAFTEHLLNSLTTGGRAVVIIPQSSVTGKTNEEKSFKTNILKKHTLEGVITLNPNTFYGVGVMPCIAIFTAHEPHPKGKLVKFIDFRQDGFKVSPHIGLVETEEAKDKKQHLLDVWFDRLEAETKFCVKTIIETDDEWLHSFYYFNDEIPADKSFEKTVGDYLSFEFSMIMQDKDYLFDESDNTQSDKLKKKAITDFRLEEREWKPFYLSGKNGLFDNDHGKRITKDNRKEGLIPLLTAGEQNNGIADFIGNSDMKLFKHFISIDMFGNSFFHNYVCTGDDNIYFFKNENLSKSIKIFIVEMIKQNKSKFSYGKQFRQTSADTLKIMLPVTDNGQPDYAFMESYTKSLFDTKREQYIAFTKKKLATIGYTQIEPLDTKEWGEFFIEDIAIIKSGRDIYESERVSGDIPYISSTAQNNGIGYFVANKNLTFEKNCLSVNRNGSVGYSFYHPYVGLYSNDCRKLKLKNDFQFVGYFIAHQITAQKEKYNYGYKMGTGRLKRQKIMLPITTTGQPDYEFMASYIKNIDYKKRKQYLDYVERK